MPESMHINREELIHQAVKLVHRTTVNCTNNEYIEAIDKLSLLVSIFPQLGSIEFAINWETKCYDLSWDGLTSEHKTPASAMACLTTLLTKWAGC